MISPTTYAALRLLQDRGDKPLTDLTAKASPRPSDIIAALHTYKALYFPTLVDEDEDDALNAHFPSDVSAEDAVLAALPDDYSELHDALEELTPKQRRVIDMLYWQGLSLRQVSATLECTYENARLHHSNALKRLRQTYVN